ncbi:hypothetical protein GCM10025859_35590 [Alicyclobacillus fastidiosus]|nr:hypothetical protein GCM10025859_35590 [Alicyclobacillus fastidiosus]
MHLVSLTLDIPMGIVADRVGWKYTLSLSGLAGCLYCGFSLLPSTTLFGAFAAFAFRGLQLTLANGSDMAITFETVASAGSTRITRWLRVPGVAAVTASGMALFAWLLPVGKGVGFLLAQATGSAADPLIDQRLNTILPNEVRATLLSGNSTAFSLFMVVVFPSFGLLAERVGTDAAYRGCSAVLAVAVAVPLLVWVGTRWLRRNGSSRARVSNESLED